MGYAVTLAIGIILFVISIFVFQESLSFIKKASKAKAELVDLEISTDSAGTNYTPVFQFKTLTNQEIVFKHNFSSSSPTYFQGEEVYVAYDASNPSKVKVLSYPSIFIWSIVLMALSMPLIVIGGGYFFAKQYLQ